MNTLTSFAKLDDKFDTVFTSNHIPNIHVNDQTVLCLQIAKGLHRQYTLFGRATRVERIQLGYINKDGQFIALSGESERGDVRGSDGLPSFVLKISNQVMTRRLEHEIIRIAWEVDSLHTPVILVFGTLVETLG
jgi:hypothetical protein